MFIFFVGYVTIGLAHCKNETNNIIMIEVNKNNALVFFIFLGLKRKF